LNDPVRYVKIVVLARATAARMWSSGNHATAAMQLAIFNVKIVYRTVHYIQTKEPNNER